MKRPFSRSSSSSSTTSNTSSRLRCKICEDLFDDIILGSHSKLCRQLNTSSKNIKQLNRLLLHYLSDDPNEDPRVLLCGRAAVDVAGTSLASPQKLNHIITVLQGLKEEDDPTTPLNTDILQQLMIQKRKLVKELIKISFEMDSLSLTPRKGTGSAINTGTGNGTATVTATTTATTTTTTESTQETSSMNVTFTIPTNNVTSFSSDTTTDTTDTTNTTTNNNTFANNLHSLNTTTSITSSPIGLRRTYSTTHVTDLDIRNRAPQPTRISDFQILKPISKGAFGAVYLVRKKKNR